jgi:hypothetical protein
MCVEHDRPAAERPERLDEVERMLAERGHSLGATGIRLATGKSGVAVGLPNNSMVHVSWVVLSALALLTGAVLARRRRSH